MELGVLWLLAEKPLSAPNVAQSLNIPLNRCHHWLQLLCRLGLLEDSAEGYAPSIIARKAILNAQSQDTWAFQACEDRDSSLFVRDLALNISKPMSTWQTRNLPPPEVFEALSQLRTLDDLLSVLRNLTPNAWLWVDFFMGIRFQIQHTDEPGEPISVWSASDFWGNFLCHLSPWLI